MSHEVVGQRFGINVFVCDAVPEDTLTDEMGACERPAFTPVTPHVRTPPRPFVLKEEPNT